MIRQLSDDLDRYLKTNKHKEKQRFREEKQNNDIAEPLEENKRLVEQLKKKRMHHD